MPHAYITRGELRSVLSDLTLEQLADDLPADGISEVDDILNEIIQSATSRVDSAIGRVYNVPIEDPIPPAIKRATKVIAKKYLYERRDIPDDTLKASFKDAVTWLREVSRGEAEIAELEARGASDDDDAFAGVSDGSVFGNHSPFGR